METAPAPRVVYQSRVSGTLGQRDPPETTTGVPDEELTPVEACRLLELDDVDEDVDDADVELLAPWVAVALPGIVAAPMAPNTPTAARALIATPVVRRFRVSMAASRALTRASVVLSMFESVPTASQVTLRAT